MRNRQAGYSLVEILSVVAIIGTLSVIAMPAFFNLRKQQAVNAATSEIRGILHRVRSRAIARGSNSAVKFVVLGGTWHYAIYDDGDGDGVRNADITSGVDRLVAPPQPVLHAIGFARIGIPVRGVKDVDSATILHSTDSPVRFGVSTLCSFSSMGSGTPGSVFLTDGDERGTIVRVFGASGRIRVMRFNRGTNQWEDR
ncbi:MAG: prepilin-type N-terminal cleavage/methylation domain-containing protein [Acidobacteriota bacterium]